MAQHARLAASGTSRWAVCPGSLAMVEALPASQKPGGKKHFADLGTAAHALLERCLSEGSEPVDYRGRVIAILRDENDDAKGTSILKKGSKNKDAFPVDDDMVESVTVATDYVRGRLAELDGATLRLETRVVPIPGRDDSFGTCDVEIDCWPEVIEIIDFKNGSGVVVEVKGNMQGRSYALEPAREANFTHDLYRITIVQPRAPHEDGMIRTEELTGEELREWGDWLKNRAENVDEADAARGSSDMDAEEWHKKFLHPGDCCQWCDAKALCPALNDVAAELAQADFSDDPEEGHAIPVPRNADDVARMLKWVPVLDSLCRAVEGAGERFLLAGEEVDNQKLVRKRSNRRWKEGVTAVAVMDWAKENDAIPHNRIPEVQTDPALKTGPQVEKLVRPAMRGLFNDEFLHKPPGGITMAPAGDKRDAVSFEEAQGDAQADFEDADD